MAECGGVGGSGNGGGNAGQGASSVGGSDSSSSVGKSDSNSNSANSVGSADSANETAKSNNVDGAKEKTGIDREAQQKADVNAKTETAQMEQAKADQKAESAKAEAAKAEQAKAEKTKEEAKKEQTLADKVVEKAKEMMAKATEIAQTAKQEFDKAVERAKEAAALQKELADLARQPEVRAMLDTIGFTEGTGLNYGKVVNGTVIGQNKKDMPFDEALTKGMKNVSTLDMSQHPNVAVRVNSKIVSSAAGRYQFLSGTWRGVSEKLGLANFHATSQDIAAVQLMKDRGMIEPLLNGDLQTAVNRGAGEWASLPKADGDGAYEGQNARSFEAIERAYNDFLQDAEAMANVGDFN
jgi:muramidase (phage lysozyme)